MGALAVRPLRQVERKQWGFWGFSLAANNGFTIGIRNPGQTYSQCLASNTGNYSIAGVANVQNSAGKFLLGNDVGNLLFGDAAEGQAGLLVAEGGTRSIAAGVGGYLDAQPLASGNVYERAAYGNYVFGAYMAAHGVPLMIAMGGANFVAYLHWAKNPNQYSGRVMDQNYPMLPVANVANITAGYNAQKNGTLCH